LENAHPSAQIRAPCREKDKEHAPITITNEDYKAFDLDQDDPTVISIELVDYNIDKVLVD